MLIKRHMAIGGALLDLMNKRTNRANNLFGVQMEKRKKKKEEESQVSVSGY